MERHRPALVIRPREDGVIIPAFTAEAQDWLGRPRIALVAELNNVVPISLAYPHDEFVENGVICVSYILDNRWVRYVLWEHSLFSCLTVYSGQRLGLDARLEVWTVGEDAPTLSSSYTIKIGKLTPVKWRASYEPGTDTLLSMIAPTCIPYSACSPFCNP